MAVFTPIQSGVGGLLIGTAAVAKLVLTGKVLGVSGIVRGLFTGDWSPWRWSFVSGVVSGGFLAARLLPGVFEPMPISIARALIGGVLVGFGSSMGNGCTSGHGICGNARLSVRSMAYTVVFMVSGFATAAVFNTASAFNLVSLPAKYSAPSETFVSTAKVLIPLSLAAISVPVLLARWFSRNTKTKSVESPIASNVAEFATGTVFSLGLSLSGMTLPSKIVGFLSIFHPGFDLSLIFVMGGALMVALPGVQYVLRSMPIKKAVCGGEICLPTATEIDIRLILGSIVFGMGWGISGLCPGPAVANLANASSPILMYMAGLGGGFVLDKYIGTPVIKQLTS